MLIKSPNKEPSYGFVKAPTPLATTTFPIFLRISRLGTTFDKDDVSLSLIGAVYQKKFNKVNYRSKSLGSLLSNPYAFLTPNQPFSDCLFAIFHGNKNCST